MMLLRMEWMNGAPGRVRDLNRKEWGSTNTQ